MSEPLTLDKILASKALRDRLGVKLTPDGLNIEIDWRHPMWFP